MGLAELTRNAVDVKPEGGLEQKLALGRPLRVKLGIDPTAPDIHLGFAVVLRRLRAFQDDGHVAVLIVGDYTARIGDPSGRSKERQVLPDEVLDHNAKLFAEQVYRILDRARTEIRFNGE
jgi:tyrosyl-tRNA synthetase